LYLAGDQHPHAVTAATGRGSWLASAAFPGPALLAAAAAVTVAAAPWLSRPWRRTAWITLAAAAAARLITGTVLPAELILALAAGVTVGAGVLVAFGVPDRRIGPGGIAAALRSAGLHVTSVEPAHVEAKGSRPFVAPARRKRAGLTRRKDNTMLSHDNRWSLPRGNTLVPSRWQATAWPSMVRRRSTVRFRKGAPGHEGFSVSSLVAGSRDLPPVCPPVGRGGGHGDLGLGAGPYLSGPGRSLRTPEVPSRG
jgi:hypothetical protein